MIIFISGPYSSDPLINTCKAIQAGEEVVKLGHTPYIPHLNLIWDMFNPHPKNFWCKLDLGILYKCDGILRLPGESPGADQEIFHAVLWQLKIFHRLEDIPNEG